MVSSLSSRGWAVAPVNRVQGSVTSYFLPVSFFRVLSAWIFFRLNLQALFPFKSFTMLFPGLTVSSLAEL